MLLVDETLRVNDLPLAARLQSLMDGPPLGVDYGAWTVRTARILILGGEAVRGARQLGKGPRRNEYPRHAAELLTRGSPPEEAAVASCGGAETARSARSPARGLLQSDADAFKCAVVAAKLGCQLGARRRAQRWASLNHALW